MLYALGAFSGGVALWVENGKLICEYNLIEIERTRLESSDPLPNGKINIEVETRKAGRNRDAPLDVVIRVDGKKIAKGCVPRSAPLAFSANDAFDVGRDSYTPVSLAYLDYKLEDRVFEVSDGTLGALARRRFDRRSSFCRRAYCA